MIDPYNKTLFPFPTLILKPKSPHSEQKFRQQEYREVFCEDGARTPRSWNNTNTIATDGREITIAKHTRQVGAALNPGGSERSEK